MGGAGGPLRNPKWVVSVQPLVGLWTSGRGCPCVVFADETVRGLDYPACAHAPLGRGYPGL